MNEFIKRNYDYELLEKLRKTKKVKFYDLIEIFGKQVWYWTNHEIETLNNIDNLNRDENYKNLILEALQKNDWSQTKAAKAMGTTSRAINYAIQKFGINHPSWKRKNLINLSIMEEK